VSRDWALFLADIAEACCLVEEFTAGLTGESFSRNPLAFHATVRNLEIIGEAAKRLPEEAMARMSEVDWSGAARFRDVIAHRYFSLDPEVVWNIVETKIPTLCLAASRLLGELKQSGAAGNDA
jgi:uncharacterized protein with HEPN domain